MESVIRSSSCSCQPAVEFSSAIGLQSHMTPQHLGISISEELHFLQGFLPSRPGLHWRFRAVTDERRESSRFLWTRL